MPEPKNPPPPIKRKNYARRNPAHEGLSEAQQSGAALSRRRTLGPAFNGVPHHEDVACDRRIRAAADEERRINAQCNAVFDRLNNDLSDIEARLGRKL